MKNATQKQKKPNDFECIRKNKKKLGQQLQDHSNAFKMIKNEQQLREEIEELDHYGPYFF
jgi:hypothetical protein